MSPRKREPISIWLVLPFSLILVASHSALGQLANTLWPKFQNDAQNSGRSPQQGPQSPQVKWRTALRNSGTRGIAIGQNNTIYVGGDSRVVSLTDTGSTNWIYEGIDSLGIAIRADGKIISSGPTLAVFNPDGSVSWRNSFGGSFPTIASDGTIYVGRGSQLFAFTPNGEQKWNFVVDTGTGIGGYSPALGADGTVYVGGSNGALYAVNPTGTLRWKYKAEGEAGVTFSAPVVTPQGRILWGTWRGEGLNPTGYLNCISSSGTLIWRYGLGLGIEAPPAVTSDGTIYGNTVSSFISLGADGVLRWKRDWSDTSQSRVSPVIGSDGTVYIARRSALYAFASNGDMKWQFQLTGEVESPLIIGSNQTLYVFSGNALTAVGNMANQTPIANAGPDQIVSIADTVSLSGSAVDADGDPLTYEWTQVAGPTVQISSSNQSKASFVAPFLQNDTELVFQLAVSDGKGGVGTARTKVAVKRGRWANLLFPQFVNGEIGAARNKTRVILRNNSSISDSGEIRFRDASGNITAVGLNGTPTSAISYSLPAWGTLDLDTDGTGTLQSGIVEVVSNRGQLSSIEGIEIFEVLGNYVSVNQSLLLSGHQVYVSVNSNENTGVAFYNPGVNNVTLNLVLFNHAGREAARKQLALASGEQLVRFVTEKELFQEFFISFSGEFKGTLNISVASGRNVAVLGLLQKRSTGALFAVPTSISFQ